MSIISSLIEGDSDSEISAVIKRVSTPRVSRKSKRMNTSTGGQNVLKNAMDQTIMTGKTAIEVS